MAKVLDKDPFTYQREHDSFLRDLQRFHIGRGTSYRTIPAVFGKQVDLYLLYSTVTRAGGWLKVNDEQRWEDIQELFGIPRACSNASQALKHIYVRYLSHYEKLHHFGEDPDRIRDDQGDDKALHQRKKISGPQWGVPLTYNHGQHILPDHMRSSMRLSTASTMVSTGDYTNLELALLSGMPNEVDFALNVCTLLSNEGRHTLKLQKCPRILKLLCAHIGIYEEDYESMYTLQQKAWQESSKRNFLKFWHRSIRDREMRKYISPGTLYFARDKPSCQGYSSPVSDVDSPPRPCTSGDPGLEGGGADVSEEVEEDHKDMDNVLNLGNDLGIYDLEGQRVLQLAMIMRNLSFEQENMKVMSKNPAVYRFLLLCIHSKYNNLNQLALDTLSNIALQMVLEPIRSPTTRFVLETVASCIASADKFKVVNGLDIVSRLCQVDANDEVLCDNLEDSVYEDIIRLLTVQDIQLIVYTLEALYQLSELGEVTTTHIAAVRMAVETLVNLVTVEAQSYGPQSLIGIKVVEHVTSVPVEGQVAPAPSQTSIQQQMAAPQVTPADQSKHTAAVARGSTSGTPQRSTAQVKRPAVPTAPTKPVGAPSIPNLAALTQHLELDSDTQACNWLQNHYQYVGAGLPGVDDMPKMELYGEYLTQCGRQQIKSIVNATAFGSCVRITFPKVDSVKIKKPDGSLDHIFRGLKKKTVNTGSHANTEASQSTPMRPPSRTPTPNSPMVAPSPPPQRVASPNLVKQIPPPIAKRPLVNPVSLSQQPGFHGNQMQSPPVSPTKFAHSMMNMPQVPLSPTPYPTIQQALMGQSRPAEASARPSVPPSPQQNISNAVPSQASNTTLIKSLLASKVAQNLNRQNLQSADAPSTNAGIPGTMPVVSSPASSQPWPSSVPPFQSYSSQPQGNTPASTPAHIAQEPTCATNCQTSQGPASFNQPSQGQIDSSVSPSAKSAKRRKSASSPPNTPISSAPSTPTSKSKPKRSPRPKPAKALDTVFTDSKALEDVIESVARQGSFDSDSGDSKMEQDDVGHDMDMSDIRPLADQEPEVSKPSNNIHNEPMDGVVQGSMENKSPAGDAADNILNAKLPEPCLNGTDSSDISSKVSNGSQHCERENGKDKPSTVVPEKNVVPDKASLKNIANINGVVHHIGNGDCSKPVKNSSKCLQVLNNRICENSTALNSSTPPANSERDALLNLEECNTPGDNSMGSNIQCEEQVQMKVIDEEKDTKIVENGFPKPSETQESYELPQVDGTHDVDDNEQAQATGTTTTTVQATPAPSAPVPSAPAPQTQVPAYSQVYSQVQAVPPQGQVSQISMAQVQPMVSQYQMVPPTASIAMSAAGGQMVSLSSQPMMVHPSVSQPQVIQQIMTQPQVVGSTAPQQVAVMPGQTQQMVVQAPGQVQASPQGVIQNPVQLQQTQQHLQLQQQQLQMQLQQLQQMQQQIQQQQWLISQQQVQPTPAGGTPATVPVSGQGAPQSQAYILPKAASQPNTSQIPVASQEQPAQSTTPQPPASSQISPSQQPYILPKSQGQQPVQIQGIQTQVSQQMQPVTHQLIPQSSMATTVATSQVLASPSPATMVRMSVAGTQPQVPQPVGSTSQTQVRQITMPAARFVVPPTQLLSVQGQVLNPQAALQAGSTAIGQPRLVHPVTTQLKQGVQQQVVRPGQPVTPTQQQVIQGQTQIVHSQVQQMQTAGVAVTAPVLHGQPQVVQQAQTIVTGQAQVRPQYVTGHQHVVQAGQPQQVIQQQGGQQVVHQIQSGTQVGQQVLKHPAQPGQQILQPGQQVVQQTQSQIIQTSQPQVLQQVTPGHPQYVQHYVQQGQVVRTQIIPGQPGVAQQVIRQQLVPVSQPQLLQGQPQMIKPPGHFITSKGQVIQTSQLVQPGMSQVQLLQHAAANGGKLTVILQGKHDTLHYVPPMATTTITTLQGSQPSLLQQSSQQRAETPNATQPSVSAPAHQPVVTAPSIQIPASQSSTATLQAPVTAASGAASIPSPISTPPPASPQSSKASPTSSVGSTKKKRPARTSSTEKLSKKKKPSSQSRSSSTDSQPAAPVATSSSGPISPAAAVVVQFSCDWAGCKMRFETTKSINRHVIKEHFENEPNMTSCQWLGCDGVKRQKWSLMTHLQDRHLNESSLKASLTKRQQAPTTTSAPPPQAPVVPVAPPAPPQQPGSSATTSSSSNQNSYPQDAAMQAIRRFAARPPFSELQDVKEGPVTKHIRLTSALILRNLARYSALGRSQLKKHEQHLAQIALSSVEASNPLSTCLWELHQGLATH